MNLPRSILLGLLAAVVFSPAAASAQATTSRQVMSNATELDPDDPRAQRASTLVTLLLGTDPAEAEKYLKTHAATGSSAATDVAKQVKELRAALAAGLVVGRVVAGPDNDLLVMLHNTTGERGGRMGVRVAVEPAAPHRILEVRTVQPRRERGGGA